MILDNKWRIDDRNNESLQLVRNQSRL